MKFLSRLLVLAAAAAVSMPTIVVAQEAEDEAIEEIVTIGSRAPGRTAENLPVPVDSISSDTMTATGQTEVGRMLQTLAPSFNFSSSSISDGTDALRPATLRGLGPDQTLVLVNGKRRHQAALIHINTSVGRGTAGTDLNAIPATSIKRIEVLRDGAAAQYGSDAIAGVINIVLNDASEGGHFSISQGEFTEGDGQTSNINFSKGFELGSAGFLNASLNYRDRDFSNRAGLHGACQFPGCSDTDDNGIVEPGDSREVTATRETFRIGDAISEQFAMTLNTAIELGDGELYGFVTYSDRDNQSAAFFRHNGNTGGNAPLADGDATIPAGFLPKINTEIQDMSYSFGYKAEFDNDATLDFSFTRGDNTIDYVTSDSMNSSFANVLLETTSLTSDEIRASVPREAFAYGLELGLQTINLDFTQSYDQLFFAMGVQLRTDEYAIIPGEEYSHRDYDTENGVPVFPLGADREAAIQGFNGIGPLSATDEDRDVFSVYLDAEYEFSDRFMVGAAVRYDDYDGFGDTTNFKLATNVGLTDAVSLRASVSTGFRAPSMQQLYFNNISTQFVSDVDDIDGDGDVDELIPEQRGTFRNDSALAQAIGIPALKEEESVNYSLGLVASITDQFGLTLDYYSIDIDDRIVISTGLTAALGSPALTAALLQSGAGSAQFFLNGADTETTGFDIVATYSGVQVGNGNLDFTLAANFTETDVVALFTPSNSGLSGVDTEDVFSSQDISIIEEWQPEDRIGLNTLYTNDRLAVNLALNNYGEYTVEEGSGARQTYSAKLLTDLNISYSFDNGITVNIAGNNIFDETPDVNEIGNSRGGVIEDGPSGPIIVDSAGIFVFSRRSAPFGFNGAYWSAGFSWDF